MAQPHAVGLPPPGQGLPPRGFREGATKLGELLYGQYVVLKHATDVVKGIQERFPNFAPEVLEATHDTAFDSLRWLSPLGGIHSFIVFYTSIKELCVGEGNPTENAGKCALKIVDFIKNLAYITDFLTMLKIKRTVASVPVVIGLCNFVLDGSDLAIKSFKIIKGHWVEGDDQQPGRYVPLNNEELRQSILEMVKDIAGVAAFVLHVNGISAVVYGGIPLLLITDCKAINAIFIGASALHDFAMKRLHPLCKNGTLSREDQELLSREDYLAMYNNARTAILNTNLPK